MIRLTGLALLSSFYCASVLAIGGDCPPAVPTPGQYGPYDYTNAGDFSERLPVVEQYHLTMRVQNFELENENPPGAHLDYTLRAFPNHYRALELMSRLGDKEKTARPSGANYSVECYFERAMNFGKDDPMVMMLYANHLHRHGKKKEAMGFYQKAHALKPNDATINYNLGLAYFDAKNYGKSLHHAQVAYRQGFPLPGLKRKLQKAGQWK